MVVTSILGALSCGSSPTAPTGPLTFSGGIRVYTTSAPRAGSLVRYVADTGGPPSTATTSTDGSYVLTVPSAGAYVVTVDGSLAGTTVVTGPTYRGDLLVDTTGCTARYGQITDALTGRPVNGATASLPGGSSVSDADGRYRIDLGCETNVSFSTTFISVRHPRYQERQQVVGRGVQNVLRLDLRLDPL